MGSPKQPQRLQLSRPDEATEAIALRSPISSRIWQAEDPTQTSGFDGEDICMRHFCVSVHGDHEPMEGSFSFDTDGDGGTLEVRKNFSMDTDGTYSFHESREDQISLNPGVSESETISKRPLEERTNISVPDGKEKLQQDLPKSENVLDCTQQMRAPHIQVKDISLQEKGIVDENVELTQGANSRSNEVNRENCIEGLGLACCKEAANGEQGEKTYTSELMPLNKDGVPQEKQYRSIAVSPIVPPDGSPSFTFQSGIRAHQSSSVLSCEGRADGKETRRNEDVQKSPSIELTPPNHNDGIETNVQYRSVAVSPIIPPGDTSSFTFQSVLGSKAEEDLNVCGTNQSTDVQRTGNPSKTCSPECICVSSTHNDGTETRVEYKSIAVSPIIPPDGSTFTFHTLSTLSGSTTGGQGMKGADLLPKKYSFELTPSSYDVGTQADRRAECVSVAVSPIIPPDGSSSFIFQSEQLLNAISGGKESETDSNCVKPIHAQNEDSSTQPSTKVQCVSVAISPIVLSSGFSSFTFLAEKPAPSTEDNRYNNIKSTDNLPKTYSFELTPPDEEPGARIEYRSVAVSPIIPPEEVSFTFQNERTKGVDLLPKKYSFELTPPNQDIGTQAGNKVECVSVAVSPIVISQESSSFSFQTHQTAPNHDQTQKEDMCNLSAFPKLEPAPQYQDVGIQVDSTVQCSSIAVSPMIPLQGSCSFVFQTDGINQASTVCSHLQEKPLMIDAEMQVSFPVETRSTATDPMTPRGKSPQASYPEVHVKETKTVHPEPVREVSWDEKGMTWEVYGASMEVEVLGMAIQKHLEKQIEEHGRQKVMTPQSTRVSSVRGATAKSEAKRQPGTFRSFFSVRRSRCCSRSAPTVD